MDLGEHIRAQSPWIITDTGESRPVSKARVDAAIEQALDQFWAVFAQHFPEAVAGDLDPDTCTALERIAWAAGKRWIDFNVEFRPHNVLDMTLVASLVEQHGVTAGAINSGGGTATIYAGEPSQDENGDERYPVVVGPGWFEANARAYGSLGELYLGPEDDTGDSAVAVPPDFDERNLAGLIVALVQEESG